MEVKRNSNSANDNEESSKDEEDGEMKDPPHLNDRLDCDDSDSEGEVDLWKFNSGFLKGTKGVFKDKKNNDNQKKTRKRRKSNSNQIGGNDKSDELEVKSTLNLGR